MIVHICYQSQNINLAMAAHLFKKMIQNEIRYDAELFSPPKVLVYG